MSENAITKDSVEVPQWTVGDRLRKAREHAGFEQQQLSEISGISATSISALEKNKTQPRKSTLNLWALATGVSIDWILTGKAPTGDNGGGDPIDLRARRDSNSRPSGLVFAA